MRISIVVPHLGDNAGFEESLVSVLENRPAGSEVCVVHDGSYQDPFDLGDEVRFIRAESSRLPRLIAAAAEATSSRVIHILGNGIRATSGWTEVPLRRLSGENCALVAPLLVDQSERTAAAGWVESAQRVYAPMLADPKELSPSDLTVVRGVYLAASFWRRSELLAVSRAAAFDDWSACEFAWSRLLVDSGWSCEATEDSIVIGEPHQLVPRGSFEGGRWLRSLATEFSGGSQFSGAARASVASLLRPIGLFRTGGLAQVAGQLASVVARPAGIARLRRAAIEAPKPEGMTMPATLRIDAYPAGIRRCA